MKKNYFLIASIALVLFVNFAFGQTQPPNGNFETWASPSKAELWNSSASVIIVDLEFAEQSAISHEGTSAAKITSQDLMGMATVPGICTYGAININIGTQSATINGGVAFNEKPTKISGWYQYAPQGPDSMIVFCMLSKFNSVSGVSDTLATAAFITTQTVSNYTQFNVDFDYSITDQTPDTMNIMILSSGLSATAGSYALIDDLKFQYGPVSVNNNEKIDYYLYPNPSNGIFNISLAKNEHTTFTVFNHMGQKVSETNTSDLYNVLDLSGFSKGVYLLEINNGKTKQVEKLLIQ